jgi:hypothetical protein
MAPPLRRFGVPRVAFVFVSLVFGCIALVGATGATAGPAVTTSMQFDYTASNPCAAGELFAGTGTIHMTLAENESTSAMLESQWSVHIDGLKAATVAPFPPKRYVVQDTFDHSFGFDETDGAPSRDTFQMTAHYIRQGEDGMLILGDDFYARFFAHVTANANGQLTAFNVDAPEVSCR